MPTVSELAANLLRTWVNGDIRSLERAFRHLASVEGTGWTTDQAERLEALQGIVDRLCASSDGLVWRQRPRLDTALELLTHLGMQQQAQPAVTAIDGINPRRAARCKKRAFARC